MPTERFFRLPKEKAETIRQAAMQEFIRVSPAEASINKIIQAVDISRGSCYTYFEDKYDLLDWLMEDGIKRYQSFYLIELKKNNGDIWDVLDRVFEDTIQWATEEGFVGIIRNVTGSNMTQSLFDAGPRQCPPEAARDACLKQLYPIVDKEKCPASPEQFQDLMEMHAMSLVLAVKMFLLEKKPMEQVVPAYRRRNRLLRYGVCLKSEQAKNN